ncbi:MAG TPA: class I SAM-dependent rRNA methyltransferase [Planctomycetota bacterium]|nr:class I SAM-dependent rRNA methyltransferase [Planctomycetota bacterium]
MGQHFGMSGVRPAPITLKKRLTRVLRQGHPWVFRDALERPPNLASGMLVELRTRDQRPVGVGYWDARSPIAVRVLEPGPLPDAEAAVRARLRAALQRRLERLDRARTTAFRWVHGEADRLPGIHVDLYDDAAVVRFDGSGAQAFYREIGAALAEAARPLPVRTVIDRQTGAPLLGRAAAGERVVLENGLKFEVSLGVGGKGGLFLDQRENREEVERRASGRSVLNLFGYTGAFAMYAIRGGARSTDTVDTARPALAAARRNFDRNGMPSAQAGFHGVDAFEFLQAAVHRGRRWDLVISDPPSFAPRKSARENARRAYTRLHRLAATVTAPGGVLCAASCSSHFGREEFLASVDEGARAAGRRFALEEMRGAGFDHPVLPAFPEGDYLKFAIGQVQ